MTLPLEIREIGGHEILVAWEDGHRSLYRCRDLRLVCPCAMCQDEMTGERILKPEQVAQDISLVQTEPVGRYGCRFRWSDKHDTGIYSFDYLRGLCPCEKCSGGAK